MVDEGLLRVLAGSEVFGPCLNKICGFADITPPWQENLLQHNHVEFKDLIISFVYIKSLTDVLTRADIASTVVDTAASRKSSILYAVVLNTGAWDFDFIARKHKGTIAVDECNTKEMMNISRSRASPAINESMWELSREASLLNIRLVYRNNHHNARFGTRCADDDFQLMLRGSAWEIWDNRRLSDGIWMKQTWDGFHFDRHEINLAIDHKAQRDFYTLQSYEAPGQLEQQLAQSLLQLLFHGCLRDDRFESIIRKDHGIDKDSSNTSLEDIWRTRFSSAKQHGYWDPTKITQNVYANSWIKHHWVRNSIGQ